jgi:hypothetical protein
LAADLILGKVLNLLPVLHNIKILSSVARKSKPEGIFYLNRPALLPVRKE